PGKDVAFTRIDNSTDGRFSLSGLPETGYVQVLAPGYSKAVLEIKAGAIGEKIELEPFSSKALYVKTSVAAWQPERLQEFFDVIDRTEVNSLVIDLKSDNLEDLGLIYYQSNVPIIKELGTSKDYMDIRAILAEAKKRNVYTIARVHIFAHDNLLARTKPEWAAQDTRTGKEFYADWDIAWLDPWNRNVWDYNIQLGVEAAQLGFDEVQFDYIRFPNDAKDIEYMKLSKPHDPEKDAQAMYENIAEFMKTAHRAINGAGAFFSVDVFGYAAWAPQTIIGQNLSLMAPHADYVCPMVYPSHFYNNELGFDNAAAHPYEIITESMKRGSVLVEGKRAKLRPWLQDFTLIWVPKDQIVRYGVKEVRAQIDAADNYPGVVGWALWSADNLYTYDALKPEE
ncbi:MAG: putative glycoside hydrolase, partial [Chloroflexaceae bacterium]|nr:putative glycoside hydrolase [Chloroflexaceae bacterium]